VTVTQGSGTDVAVDAGRDFGPPYADATAIGRGAVATVYWARAVGLGRNVAIKLFDAPVTDEQLAGAFRRECAALAEFGDHPNVVPVLDGGLTVDQRPFIVMDYYDLGSLAAGRPLPPDAAVAAVVAVAEGLQIAFRAPGDVAVDPNGESFDVAFNENRTVTNRFTLKGSRHYIGGLVLVNFLVNAAYSLDGGATWVNGRRSQFTAPE
jgi:hypothetical protein